MSDIDVLLLDLDGVVRLWDPEITTEIERAHGLPAGIIVSAASGRRLINALVTGVITREEWLAQIAALVGSPEAIKEWGEQEARIDTEVVDAARRARKAGVRIALLTNGSDTVDAQLDQMGLADDFDAVFNSSQIGIAKPDLEVFVHVLGVLEVPAQRVLYLDDSETHVRSAAALGIRSMVFSPESRADALAAIAALA